MGVDWRNPGGTIPWLLGGRAGVRAGGQESEGCCTVLPWVPAEADVGQGPGVCWCGLRRLAREPIPCSCLCYQVMGHKKCSLVPLTPKRVLAVPYPFGIYSRVSEWFSFTYSQYASCTAISLLCHMAGEP